MNYALLIYRASPPSEPVPPEDVRAALAGHREVQAEASARGQLHAVARLDETGRARTVRKTGSTHEVTDGPYIETKEWLVGFYVVDCDSEQQAVERARRLCPDSSHVIEVRPVTWRWKP